MKLRRNHALEIIRIVCAGSIATMLTGCGEDRKADASTTPVPVMPELSEVRRFELSQADGAVLFLKDGTTVVVDETGAEAPKCLLPPASDHYEAEKTSTRPTKETARSMQATASDAEQFEEIYKECPKAVNTTLNNINSFAVVRHTGSHCYIVGGKSFGAGKPTDVVSTFPAGCNPQH